MRKPGRYLNRLLLLAVWPGIHAPTSAAESAETAWGAHCARCHAPAEIRGRLETGWIGRSTGELLSRVRETMPAESPGSLTDREYTLAVQRLLELAGAELAPASDPGRSVIQLRASSATAPDVPWRNFGGDLNANRHAPLADIDASNARNLAIAWRWNAANFGPTPEIRNVSMPIMHDGRLFVGAGATRNIVAVDAASGQTLWMWRPREGARFDQAARKDSGKGLSFYRSGGGRGYVVAVTPGYSLVKLDAETGLPDPAFGTAGIVDLTEGLRRAPDRPLDIGLTAPPLVVGDMIIVGSAHAVSFRPPSKANVKGDVRAFDARTGELKWSFRTIPEPGEPGIETWLGDSAAYTGNAGVWAPMSADPELGLVYLPVESATGDQYGGDRPGANLFSSSLVAVDVETGQRRWHFQHTHHDIWDWDTPTAPVLADLPDGRAVVALPVKQGFVFVFDRATGEPIWPIDEVAVPASDVPGEWTAPTQPVPRRPPAFDRQGVSREDLIDYTPAIRAEVDAILDRYRIGPLYQPPSLADAADGTHGTLRLPSSTGGANWEGSAYDPQTGVLYVPSRTQVEVMQLVHDPEASDIRFISGRARPPKVFDIPIAKPPWGRITAIDLVRGTILWTLANGDTPEAIRTHPALEGVTVPRTGKPTRAGILVTDTLLFAGEGFGGDPVFRAHDKRTGEIVAEIDLPASQAGPPSTYRVGGRQFIVMTVADGKSPAELIALALPQEHP
jgi:quinoprotein glucose dehydrogenase